MQDDVLEATATDAPAQADTIDMADLSQQDWLDRIEELGEERGYFEPLGKRHSVVLTDEGPTLIVTFETVETIREGSDSQEPMGWELVEGQGWSNLSLIAHDDTWFRDPAVYGYFDRLVDDGFFEDFDHVVFYGAGMCAYAAAAYSVVAPGATVIALQPQATLDPKVARWDQRFPQMRRVSFSDRYGYAPDMVEGAEQVFVIHDPEVQLDAMHASLFTRANVTQLTCPRLGDDLEAKLWRMGVLPEMLDLAARDELTATAFHRAYRQARRVNMPYLRSLLDRLQGEQRHRMVQMLCNSVVKRMNAPRFRRARDGAAQMLDKTREVEELSL
ncbi:phosphoadenosine phosphosulfate reductase [Aliiroseovarius sp.]|uniref:phosphoadenosine phosphosulfate reductase n=1 Tax=Aliiroseovarius sp. TaxID=1872442 RepID=UPI003BAB49E4